MLQLNLIARLAWKQYLARFDVILVLNLLIGVPLFFLVDVTIPRTLIDQALPLLSSVNDWMNLLLEPAYLGNLLLQQVVNLVVVFINVTIILSMHANYHRVRASIKQLAKAALQLFPAAIVLTVIVHICVNSGLLLFIIPGIFLAISLSLALPALVWKKMKIGAALLYSWQLVRSHWWPVTGQLLWLFIITNLMSWFVLSVLPDTIGFTTAALTIGSIIDAFSVIYITILFTSLDATQDLESNQTAA